MPVIVTGGFVSLFAGNGVVAHITPLTAAAAVTLVIAAISECGFSFFYNPSILFVTVLVGARHGSESMILLRFRRLNFEITVILKCVHCVVYNVALVKAEAADDHAILVCCCVGLVGTMLVSAGFVARFRR